MATFTINEKEYELKLTFESVKRLNNAFDGGSYDVIGRAISGDLDAFPTILQASLLHTGENFTKRAINKAIEDAFNAEELSLEDIQRIANEVVTDSFFYAPTVKKMAEQNPQLKQALDQLRA